MGTHIASIKDSSDEHKAKVKEYEKEARQELRKALLPAMKLRFPEGKKYAFWSGLEHVARQYATDHGYESLETTDLGTLFNGLKFFTGELFPSNWDAVKPLWLELSLSYAKFVSGKIHVFARWEGDIFKNVEKPNVPKIDGNEFLYHALVPLLKVEPVEYDGKLQPNCQSPNDVRDESGDEGTTAANWKTQIEAGLKAWREHHKIPEPKSEPKK
jgi:hypothetical protein